MGDFTVIGIVGEVLHNLLRTNLAAVFNGQFTSEQSVTLKSPKELEQSSTPCGLSVFLYQITENTYLKNQPAIRVGHDQVDYPPLALNLYYLITPYAPETEGIRGWDVHSILGRVMQILYDNASLEGPALHDILQNIQQTDYYGRIENIRIILHSLSLDDLTKIWNSLDTPMLLSVGYEVRVVIIESQRRKTVSRIIEKNDYYYKI